MKHSIKIACVYIGTIIGAGFASGQELAQFFVRYERFGIYGIALAAIVFFAVGYVIISKVERGADTTQGFFGRQLSGKIIFGMEVIMSLFLLCSFCVMCAGGGALLEQQFGISRFVGVMAMSAVCFVIFMFDVQGVVRFNAIVTPLLIVGMLIVAIGAATSGGAAPAMAASANRLLYNWGTSGILYASYNTITLVPLFVGLAPALRGKNAAFSASLIAAAVLFVLASLLYVLLAIKPAALDFEIPMLFVAGAMQPLYVVLLFFAMLTTAVSSGFGVIKCVCANTNMRGKSAAALLCALAIPVGVLGFSDLVKTLYPFFGYIGIFIMLITLADIRAFKSIFKNN